MTFATDSSLDLWLGKAAPRYTSYPPAPFFHTGVAAQDYRAHLQALPSGEEISLYLHIPFCPSLCLYCGCNTMITQRAERKEGYLASLTREMTMVAAITGRRRVRHLHFGGGTPNVLSPAEMRTLFAEIRRAFDLDSPREIAMELDPRHVTAEQARTLAACGVTRVSLGVQDFDPEVQAIIHRPQSYDLVARVCDELRDAGITRINLDLMYGLPKQSARTIADTAERTLKLDPDRVAIFSYAHVPQIKKHQLALEEHGLPDVHARLVLEQTARDILGGGGYHPIGIDHFAKDGDALLQAARDSRLRRSFQGYCVDETPTLVGLGSSSISQTARGYFQNEHDERGYQASIAAGRLPVRRGFALSDTDLLRREIIEHLMCGFACDVAALCRKHRHSVDAFADDFERLRPYEEAGIVSRHGHALRLTTPHRMAIRVICKVFDDYSRHSQALSSRTA